jgi:hypothetical protein
MCSKKKTAKKAYICVLVLDITPASPIDLFSSFIQIYLTHTTEATPKDDQHVRPTSRLHLLHLHYTTHL